MLPHWSIVSVMFLPMLAAFHTPVEVRSYPLVEVETLANSAHSLTVGPLAKWILVKLTIT